MDQLPLLLRLPAADGFESFVSVGNDEAVSALRQWAAGGDQRCLFLHGGESSGKSHLLQAACRECIDRGRTALYLPLDQDGPAPAMLEALESRDAVIVDAVQAIAGNAAWERALFALYNQLQDADRHLLIAARAPAAALGLSLADLTSRLCAASAYRLRPLDDEGCALLLNRAARHRGLRLQPAAVSYILTRCPRDPGSLLHLLDELDRLTLQRRCAPTVRLIGELLVGFRTAE